MVARYILNILKWYAIVACLRKGNSFTHLQTRLEEGVQVMKIFEGVSLQLFH